MYHKLRSHRANIGIPGTGQAYVVFGSNTGEPANIDPSSLDGSNGFVLNGMAYDRIGWSVSAGDVNGDGLDDMITGAPFAEPIVNLLNVDQAYVVFGSNTGMPASIDLSFLDGSNGFVLIGMENDRTGWSVIAGDVNVDGLDDMIIGAARARPNGSIDADQTYAVFGSSVSWPASFELSSLNGNNGFTVNGIAGEFSG